MCEEDSASHSLATEETTKRNDLHSWHSNRSSWVNPLPPQKNNPITKYLHASNVNSLPNAELLPHQSEFRHTVEHHVVKLRERERARESKREREEKPSSWGSVKIPSRSLSFPSHQVEVSVLCCSIFGWHLLDMSFLDKLIGWVHNVLFSSQPLINLKQFVHLLLETSDRAGMRSTPQDGVVLSEQSSVALLARQRAGIIFLDRSFDHIGRFQGSKRYKSDRGKWWRGWVSRQAVRHPSAHCETWGRKQQLPVSTNSARTLPQTNTCSINSASAVRHMSVVMHRVQWDGRYWTNICWASPFSWLLRWSD